MIPILQIDDLNIMDNILNLSISAKFKHHMKHNPRLEIIFSNEVENRRFPFKLTSFYKDDVSDCCFLSASETFEINHFFWNKEFIGDVAISFSLLYGEEFIEDFSIRSNTGTRNFTKINYNLDGSYYIPSLENNFFILEAKNDLLEDLQMNKSKFTYKALNFINQIFLSIISIISLPFFFIEGYLISKGFKDKHPYFLRGKTAFKSILFHINWKTLNLAGFIYSKRVFKIRIMKLFYYFTRFKKVKKNRILFLSERRNDLKGNFEFVYEILKDNKELDLIQFLNDKKIKDLGLFEMIKFVNLISSSNIILLDDFYPNIHNFKLKDETKLIQLWHAVGAFKTFGLSRVGKKGGVNQDSLNHRNYDYAITSSDEVKRFYSEGFAISDEKVITTGIPRTDIFFNEGHKKDVINKIYKKYPVLKDKKIILFAPTFRGEGKDDAYYPMEEFNLVDFFDSLSEDNENLFNLNNSILLIKHHPFVKEKVKIPEKYKNNVLDLSQYSEINNLLFITDLLITDYSSVIFEASLLNIPMLFYSYDLKEYLLDRGFYYDYNVFIPGKITSSLEEVVVAINNSDFEEFKIEKFKYKFFKDMDGESTKRVVQLIENFL